MVLRFLDWPMLVPICINKSLQYDPRNENALYFYQAPPAKSVSGTWFALLSFETLHWPSNFTPAGKISLLMTCSHNPVPRVQTNISLGTENISVNCSSKSKKLFSGNYSDSFFFFFFRTTTFKRCTKTLSAKWKILLMYVGLLKTSDWMVIPSTWAKHLMHTCVYPVCQLVTSSKLWQKPILSYAIRIFKDKLLTHCYTKQDTIFQISLIWKIFLLIMKLITQIQRIIWNTKRKLHYLSNCKLKSNIKIFYYKSCTEGNKSSI